MNNQAALRRVAVTGIGVLSPNGIGKAAFADACRTGRSGVRQTDWGDLSHPDIELLKVRISAQIPDFDSARHIEPTEVHRVPRVAVLALVAAREALADAEINPADLDPSQLRRIGVSLGTGGGGVEFMERGYCAHFTGHLKKKTPYFITGGTQGNISSEVSITLGLRGPSHVLSTGCTSAHDALGHAYHLIQLGHMDACLAGGADAPIVPTIIRAFELMRVLASKPRATPGAASRPFDKDRDGFVLAEGAWFFFFEELERARARGARVYGEIVSYASSCDAYHRVQISPELEAPVRAIRESMQRSGLAADEIGYVNLHGTGTDLNDRLETLALKQAFGRRAYDIPMSATKSMIGHAQGACGAAGLAATLLGLEGGWLHPTINLDEPDEACDLDYIAHVAREKRVDLALVNCMGFGSKNSVLIVSRGVHGD